MVVKTTKTPKKTTTKKITSSNIKKEETGTNPINKQELPTLESKIETVVKEAVVDIEKDVQKTETLAKTTIPFVTNFIKKLKFW